MENKKYLYIIEYYNDDVFEGLREVTKTVEEVKTLVKNLNTWNDYTYKRNIFNYFLGIEIPENYTTRYKNFKTVHRVKEL